MSSELHLLQRLAVSRTQTVSQLPQVILIPESNASPARSSASAHDGQTISMDTSRA